MVELVKSLPEWLKRNYNNLWKQYQKEEITVENVSSSLDISASMATKTLWQLENKGFIHKTRSEIDYRNKIYRLIPPDDVKYIIGLYSLIEKDKYKKYTLKDKLILMNEELPYIITGSQAAYHYHEYMNPPKVHEIKVRSKDVGKWIAFLTDAHTRVYIDEVIQVKAAQNYIKLQPTSNNIDNIKYKTSSGLYIEKIESLLIDLFDRETETSIKEITAIIIRNNKNIDWLGDQGLIQLTLETNNVGKLGFILDAINFESESPVIDEGLITSLENHIQEPVLVMYPNDHVLLNRYTELRNKQAHQSLISENEVKKIQKMKLRYEEYSVLGSKWGIIPIISRNLIRKVITDMRVQL